MSSLVTILAIVGWLTLGLVLSSFIAYCHNLETMSFSKVGATVYVRSAGLFLIAAYVTSLFVIGALSRPEIS